MRTAVLSCAVRLMLPGAATAGTVEVLPSAMPDVQPEEWPDVVTFVADPGEANSLLATSGWRRGRDLGDRR
jgi:hypothetical protein